MSFYIWSQHARKMLEHVVLKVHLASSQGRTGEWGVWNAENLSKSSTEYYLSKIDTSGLRELYSGKQPC